MRIAGNCGIVEKSATVAEGIQGMKVVGGWEKWHQIFGKYEMFLKRK